MCVLLFIKHYKGSGWYALIVIAVVFMQVRVYSWESIIIGEGDAIYIVRVFLSHYFYHLLFSEVAFIEKYN